VRSNRIRFALSALFALMMLAAPAHAQEPVPAPMHVILVRHASAWKNVPSAQRPRPMSAAELDSLTPSGLALAEKVGKSLAGKGVVAVYTSPANRARQTAAAIAKATGAGEPITSDAFRSLDVGNDARAASGTMRMKNWKSGDDPRPPGGESLEDGLARANAELLQLAKQHPGQTIVVVTHGEIASSLITQAAGQDLLANYFKNFPDEGSVHEFDVP
jgi:broad specificity phosphatase PhoE